MVHVERAALFREERVGFLEEPVDLPFDVVLVNVGRALWERVLLRVLPLSLWRGFRHPVQLFRIELVVVDLNGIETLEFLALRWRGRVQRARDVRAVRGVRPVADVPRLVVPTVAVLIGAVVIGAHHADVWTVR